MQAPELTAQEMRSLHAGAAAPAQHQANSAPATAAELRLQRTMKFVVAGLSLLLVAGLVAVAMRVIYLASKPAIQVAPQQAAETTVAATPTPAATAELQLALRAGAEVHSVSLSGNRLAVHYEAGGVAGIAILDLETGRKLTDVTITPGPGAKPGAK